LGRFPDFLEQFRAKLLFAFAEGRSGGRALTRKSGRENATKA
jgi:hypothetical protein